MLSVGLYLALELMSDVALPSTHTLAWTVDCNGRDIWLWWEVGYGFACFSGASQNAGNKHPSKWPWEFFSWMRIWPKKIKFQVGCFLCILVLISLGSNLDVPSLLCLLLTILFFSAWIYWGLRGWFVGRSHLGHSIPSPLGSAALLIIMY